MRNLDWSQFTRRLGINSSPETIMQIWTSQENLEKWFLDKAEFTKADGTSRERTDSVATGDTYQWKWYGSGEFAQGEVLNNRGDHFIFTFLGCKVYVRVIQENGHNVLVVHQYEIPEDEASKMNLYVECTRGWTFYMLNLKSILEGGLDMRSKTMELSSVINS